jgi:hypothetical protein
MVFLMLASTSDQCLTTSSMFAMTMQCPKAARTSGMNLAAHAFGLSNPTAIHTHSIHYVVILSIFEQICHVAGKFYHSLLRQDYMKYSSIYLTERSEFGGWLEVRNKVWK